MVAEAASDPLTPAQDLPVEQEEATAQEAAAALPSRARRLLPPLMMPAALLGGFIASNALDATRETLLIACMSSLICGAWWATWRVLAETSWTAAFKSWPAWRAGQPLPSLPYTIDGSPSQRTSLRLGQFRHWLIHELLPVHGASILAAACASAAALIISAALGAQAMLLTIGLTVLAQLAMLARPLSSIRSLLHNLALLALPFTLGLAVMQPIVLDPQSDSQSATALVFAAAAALAALRGTALRHAGFAIVIALFLALRHTVGAFIIGVLWLPVLLLPGFRVPRWWPIIALLAGAVALS